MASMVRPEYKCVLGGPEPMSIDQKKGGNAMVHVRLSVLIQSIPSQVVQLFMIGVGGL